MTLLRVPARRLAATFVLLASGLVGGGATLGLVPAAVPAAGAATCTSAGGVSVVVDYRELGGSTVTACAPDGGGKSAAAVFASVGVDITYATRQPGFVCRVNGVPTSDPCVNASPANAYWGLWWSDGSSGSWTYSSSGVGALTVPAGGSVAWAWQQDRGGSPAAPSVAAPVAPAPSPTPTATPTPTSTPTSSPTSGGTDGGTGGGTAGGTGGGGSGSGSGGGTSGGSTGGASGGSTSPSASPSASTSAAASATPSASPEEGTSAGASPRQRAGKANKKGTTGTTDRTDDPGADPGAEPGADPTAATTGDETPADAGASADEPARVPAAVTWGVVGLLAVALAGSALVARRRRGTGTQ